MQSEYRQDTKPRSLYSLSRLSSFCDANWYIETIFLFGFSNINLWKCHPSATLTNSKKMRLNTKHTLVQSVSAGIIYILRLGPSHSQLDLSPLICPPALSPQSQEKWSFASSCNTSQDTRTQHTWSINCSFTTALVGLKSFLWSFRWHKCTILLGYRCSRWALEFYSLMHYSSIDLLQKGRLCGMYSPL